MFDAAKSPENNAGRNEESTTEGIDTLITGRTSSSVKLVEMKKARLRALTQVW